MDKLPSNPLVLDCLVAIGKCASLHLCFILQMFHRKVPSFFSNVAMSPSFLLNVAMFLSRFSRMLQCFLLFSFECYNFPIVYVAILQMFHSKVLERDWFFSVENLARIYRPGCRDAGSLHAACT